MDQIIALFQEQVKQKALIFAVFSSPRKTNKYTKVTLKCISLEPTIRLQWECFENNQAFHRNIELESLETTIKEYISYFKQIQLFTTTNDYTLLINKKGQAHIKKSAPTKKMPAALSHNRQKEYILNTPSSNHFLKALGLMGKDNKIKPTKYHKFKQINRYLEMLENILPELPKTKIRIIDFGCGKSYLTFAMYHYLHELEKREVEIIGLDLKKDVIHFCEELATSLGYTDLHFQVGDIGTYTCEKTIDMVVSLHACNTATDSAIAKALSWHSKVILAVPCCHHEAYTQIENVCFTPLLKHGILKERFAALATDALRATLLESFGYKVSVEEFIDMEHTPKNIMIKAIYSNHNIDTQKAMNEYTQLASFLSLDLTLAKLVRCD